jgi:hypothetical protein
MSTAEDKAWLDVRIPQRLFDQQRTGAITIAMFMTMSWLRRWADWRTGRVAHASAGGVRTAMGRAFSVRTIQLAMKQLEEMGWITRDLIDGSHEDYPVTLHNYKWIDEYGEGHILNPKPCVELARKVARKVTRKNTAETTVNTATSSLASDEACGEGGGEHCDKILHKGTSIKNNVNALSPRGDESPPSLYSALDDVWQHYLKATHRNPKRNKFSAIRKRIGIARLRECLDRNGGNRENAVKLMKLAIDNMGRSDFHMGCDVKSDGKKYNDWKYVFGSIERMEEWWQAYTR